MATLQVRLREAEAAYHDLLIGKSAVEFADQNGEKVRYTSANRAALAAYIADLKQQITAAAGGCPVTGPMRPFFL